MLTGDIVLVPFPFTDLSGSKFRPALILAKDDVDMIVAFITSQTKWASENTLSTPSMVFRSLPREYQSAKVG